MNPTVNIFGLEIASYALLALVGIVLAGFLGWLLIRWTVRDEVARVRAGLTVTKQAVDVDMVLAALIPALIGFFIGAHLLYALTNIDMFVKLFTDFDSVVTAQNEADKWAETFEYIGKASGGIVFYGGLIGAVSFAAVYCKRARGDYQMKVGLDICAPAIPLFHVFGRIGCFESGCCYGVESDIGFVYTNASGTGANYVTRFPVQLLEAGLNLILFAVLTVLFFRFWSKWQAGSFIKLYFACYAVIRFSDEFLRGDTYRGILWGLSTSQWISLAILLTLAVIEGKALLDRKQPAQPAAA